MFRQIFCPMHRARACDDKSARARVGTQDTDNEVIAPPLLEYEYHGREEADAVRRQQGRRHHGKGREAKRCRATTLAATVADLVSGLLVHREAAGRPASLPVGIARLDGAAFFYVAGDFEAGLLGRQQ